MRFWIILLMFLILSNLVAMQDVEVLENRLVKENLSNSEKMIIFNQLAAEYAKSNRIKADNYAQQALKLSEELRDDKQTAYAKLNLGLIAFHESDFQKCIELSEEVLSLAQKKNFYDIKYKTYYYLSSSYAAIQDYQKAYHFYKLYSSYIINEDENTDINEISDLTRRFEREHEHLKLKKENFDQKLSLKREHSIKQFLLVVILLIILVIGVALQQYKEKNKLIIELSNKNKEIADKNWEINEQKNQLIKQNQILQMIIDNIPNPISYKDTEGRYLGCNQYYELYSGKTFKEIEGKTAFDVFPEDVATKIFEEDEDIIKNPRIISYEIDVVTTQVERQQVLVNKAPFYDMNKNVAGVIATIYDISDIKKAEQSLMEYEHKLLLVTTEKNQFLNIIADDMKNPLAKILAISSDLYESYKDINANKRKAIIKDIKNMSEFLMQALENLITWSKSQAGSLEVIKEKCVLSDLIVEEVNSFKANNDTDSITIVSKLKKNNLVQTDKNLLRIVFRNIFAQIIKFCEGECKIEISSNRVNQSECEIDLKVENHQFSKDFSTTIYNSDHNKISQAPTTGEKTELSIVIIKDIISKINGRINVDELSSNETLLKIYLPEWKKG